jgi:RNA polymerase sigma factor (sigma-70 family)
VICLKIINAGGLSMSILNRNDSAYTIAYSENYKFVFGAIFRKIPDFDISQDLCQDVFLRLFIKFNQVINIRKWLHGTIRNVISEYYRKKKIPYIDAESVIDTRINSSMFEKKETRNLIDEAFSNPSNFSGKTEKQLFDLITIHENTYREAGLKLGMSARQVRYRYSLIINKLHHHFNRKGIRSAGELI